MVKFKKKSVLQPKRIVFFPSNISLQLTLVNISNLQLFSLKILPIKFVIFLDGTESLIMKANKPWFSTPSLYCTAFPLEHFQNSWARCRPFPFVKKNSNMTNWMERKEMQWKKNHIH